MEALLPLASRARIAIPAVGVTSNALVAARIAKKITTRKAAVCDGIGVVVRIFTFITAHPNAEFAFRLVCRPISKS